MGKPEDFRVDAAWAAFRGVALVYISKDAVREVLQAAYDAIEPTPDIVVTEEMRRAGESEVSKAYWGRTSPDWYHVAGINAYCAMRALEPKPYTAADANRDYNGINPTLTRPTARSPEPVYYRATAGTFGTHIDTNNTRSGKERRTASYQERGIPLDECPTRRSRPHDRRRSTDGGK